MKRMICYFLLCALVLACIAGCISEPPVSTPMDETTEPSGSASLANPTNGQTTQPTGQDTRPQQTQPSGQETQPQQTEPAFTVPEHELEPLPTIDREKTGPLVEYDPDRELYILTGQNDIIYANCWANQSYGFRIFSKKPLDVNCISVNVPISHDYSVSVRQRELSGTQNVAEHQRMDERCYASNTFTFPMYLAYQGKDFRQLAELENSYTQLGKLADEYYENMLYGLITEEEYKLMMQTYQDAEQAYKEYLDADWEAYLALTKEDLPQFYVYNVSVIFDWTKAVEKEESFTQIEVTIGDKTYVQEVGKVTLIEDWELPAPLDWETAYDATAGIMGNANSPKLYNDGIHCIDMYFHFVADRYKLLEELVMLNPALKVERVWLQIRPKAGRGFVVEWDMSEPYEIYPGDDVVVYAAYRDENLGTIGYQTMTDAYLLYTTDGESYCKFSHSEIDSGESDYLWYAVLFDGVDFESYYWDYYYLFNEPWRYDPE